LRRVISFHSRVSRAEQFAQDLVQVAGWVGPEHRAAGTLKTDFVSGAMPTDRRRVKLAQLKSLASDERALLANARCLSEGVDVPSLDGVAFIDPRFSQIDIIQAVGRAIRLSPSKTAGTIVLPVFIEDGADPVASIEASNFKPIWDVLNALKAHDDVLSAQLDQIRTELGKRPGSAVGSDALSRIQFDLPASVDASFGEALRTYLVERATDSWEFGFGALQAYAEAHGDCLVPSLYKLANGYRLGQWVAVQRQTRAQLSTGRKARLEALTGWGWSALDEAWETGFRRLSEYVAGHGDCAMSNTHKLADGYQLGGWVSTQMRNRSSISVDRKLRLESLPGWIWSRFDEAWDTAFRHLREYAAANGDCLVPTEYQAPGGFRLGRWVAAQRSARPSIPQARRDRLEALPGWGWNKVDEAWEVAFRQLLAYVSATGDCVVPLRKMLPNGFRLGGWVQRQRRVQASLSEARKAKLEKLPGWSWDPHDQAWGEGFRRLLAYVTEFGDCRSLRSYICADGFRLGVWVHSQRAAESKMSPDRKARLGALPGWTWNTFDAAWETSFRHLAAYAAANGDCLVASSHKLPDGYCLGQWVGVQRRGQVAMSPDRKARLEALPGWTWKVREGQ